MTRHTLLLGMLLWPAAAAARGQAMPASLRGAWRITKMLPTTGNTPCWSADRARTLLGTTLHYQGGAMTWQGGPVAVPETMVRTLSAQAFQDEYKIPLSQLGIRAAEVTEYDLQHEDADITGASTEVPGDTVLLAGPGRIVVSACGMYFAAVRVPGAGARRQ